MRLHGEAAGQRWKPVHTSEHVLALETQLPVAGLLFRREVKLGPEETVVYFHETIRNQRAEERDFHWVQHVTFGLPLLAPGESLVALSSSRVYTWPYGYEGKALLEDARDFEWPHAPGVQGTTCDISRPFADAGKGFVAAALTDVAREPAFLAVLNWRLGIVGRLLLSATRFSLDHCVGGELRTHRTSVEQSHPGAWLGIWDDAFAFGQRRSV